MFRKKKKDSGAKTGVSRGEINREMLCTMHGTRELNIENYGALGDCDEKRIVLRGHRGQLTVEGERLRIDYFTDIDMQITGKIRSIHF